MKLVSIGLCLAFLPLFGQDAVSRRNATIETLKFLEEQSALAQQQAADAQKRATEIAQSLEKAKLAAALEAARENQLPGVSAQSIQRDGTVLHLKGTVKIAQERVTVSADEADYHTDTGEIEARGNVHITPSR